MVKSGIFWPCTWVCVCDSNASFGRRLHCWLSSSWASSSQKFLLHVPAGGMCSRVKLCRVWLKGGYPRGSKGIRGDRKGDDTKVEGLRCSLCADCTNLKLPHTLPNCFLTSCKGAGSSQLTSWLLWHLFGPNIAVRKGEEESPNGHPSSPWYVERRLLLGVMLYLLAGYDVIKVIQECEKKNICVTFFGGSPQYWATH